MSTSKATDRIKHRVRDRIFATACELFYQRGIRDVGVDLIANEAGTNKMSFYRSFASKDELVSQYLKQKSGEFWGWWDGIVGKHPGDPRRQLEALFDAFAILIDGPTSTGCAFANAAVELADAAHPGRQVAALHKSELRRRFRQLAQDAGARSADELGDALLLLMDGASLARRNFSCGDGPERNAPAAARLLVEAHLQDPTRGGAECKTRSRHHWSKTNHRKPTD